MFFNFLFFVTIKNQQCIPIIKHLLQQIGENMIQIYSYSAISNANKFFLELHLKYCRLYEHVSGEKCLNNDYHIHLIHKSNEKIFCIFIVKRSVSLFSFPPFSNLCHYLDLIKNKVNGFFDIPIFGIYIKSTKLRNVYIIFKTFVFLPFLYTQRHIIEIFMKIST